MNHAYEQEIRDRLLKPLADELRLRQRDMAKKMEESGLHPWRILN